MSRGTSPFKSLRPPVQQQLDQQARAINRIVDFFTELDVKVEFAMRHIRLSRAKPGSLLDPATGKMPVEHLSLIDLFHQQRDVFIEQLMRERDAHTRAQQAAAEFGSRTGTGTGNGADADDPATPLPLVGGGES